MSSEGEITEQFQMWRYMTRFRIDESKRQTFLIRFKTFRLFLPKIESLFPEGLSIQKKETKKRITCWNIFLIRISKIIFYSWFME